MEPYPDATMAGVQTVRVYLARDGALPRQSESRSARPGVYLARDGALPRLMARCACGWSSLSSEGWSPTPTGARVRRELQESI